MLTGKVNPSGKLSSTFPVSIFDVPSTLNYPTGFDATRSRHGGNDRRNINYTLHAEGLDIGYRYFSTADKEVSYPFGYGLSYTDFTYSKPIVKKTADGGFIASVTVTNSGSVPGKESVQLYVTAPAGKLQKPSLELKSFGKTRELQPGESETLSMTVPAYDLASSDSDIQSWVTDKGLYEIKFAASADNIRCTVPFNVSRTYTWPVNDVLKRKR